MRPRGKSPRNRRARLQHLRGRDPASMRPRGSPRGIKPGVGFQVLVPLRFNEAAGKSPRNPDDGASGGRGRGASMRPRGSPRGIVPHAPCEPPCRVGASMRPRGSPRGIDHRRHAIVGRVVASMRPRGSPRGIGRPTSSACARPASFNEAAGKSPRNPAGT